jgi:serine/threonine protein kinase
VVDHYRVLRQLGRGGTAIVCAAEDTSKGRRVALKLIPHEPTPGAIPPEVLHEAQLAGRVRHPHVVSLYGTGTYRGGAYLVLELVEGQSVQALVDAGPVAWRTATTILLAACAGLRAVHACGIVHRDVKPANLLCADDGIVKLTDFGLACWLTPSESPPAWMRLSGTPHYMSPEQCQAEGCDERTDIYALGATYYELLTGRTPFEGTPLQVMLRHCSAPPPDPCAVHRDVPRACAEVVLRAMAKKRADRYDSARELQDALREVLRGRSKAWRT